jgi:hypothetical protein
METKRGVAFVGMAVLLVSGVLCVQHGLAEPASISGSEPLQLPDGPIVAGSSSTLVRSDQGVTMTIHTSGFEPGAAHMVWWVIYDKPEHCATDPHTFADFENPDVQGPTLYATGKVIGNNEVGNFVVYLALACCAGVRGISGGSWAVTGELPGSLLVW